MARRLQLLRLRRTGICFAPPMGLRTSGWRQASIGAIGRQSDLSKSVSAATLLRSCCLSSRPTWLGLILQLLEAGDSQGLQLLEGLLNQFRGGQFTLINPHHCQLEIVMKVESIATGLDGGEGVDRAAWPCREGLAQGWDRRMAAQESTGGVSHGLLASLLQVVKQLAVALKYADQS